MSEGKNTIHENLKLIGDIAANTSNDKNGLMERGNWILIGSQLRKEGINCDQEMIHRELAVILRSMVIDSQISPGIIKIATKRICNELGIGCKEEHSSLVKALTSERRNVRTKRML